MMSSIEDEDGTALFQLRRTMSLVVDRLNEERERLPCLDNSNTSIKMWGSQRRILLDVLMACWGLGTWLGVNGVYVQLPILVQRLPEGWNLATYMVLAIQLSNVGLLIYAGMKKILPKMSDTPYIYALLVIGMISLFLNSFLHTNTVTIGEQEFSMAFLIFTFFVGLVGCTSSVLFYPYLRHFRDVYLATYLVGEGLSGFIPSILALIQGIGGDPECLPNGDMIQPSGRFSTTVFLIMLSFLALISFVSFIIIHNYSGFDSERVKLSEEPKREEATTPTEASTFSSSWIPVLVLMACLNALMNGLLPSIQTYSCMPYGSRAYHLAVTLGAMANPSACLAGVFLKPIGSRALCSMLAVSMIPFVYIVTTALTSPTPPLYNTVAGELLVVVSWVVVNACLSYGRMWVYGWARGGGATGMRVCGGAGQLGSILGSLVTFALVNYTDLFVASYFSCPSTPV